MGISGVVVCTIGEGDALAMEGGADVGKLQARMASKWEIENIQ
jgi:hypothetical protein